jgi:hypothetical protein
MKPLPESDFRAKRLMLEDDDFALVSGAYEGPTDLVAESTWRSMVSLPDDVSIRTSDRYGTQLEQMWEYWGIWNRVVLAVQALSKDPSESPMAIASCDAADEFQGRPTVRWLATTAWDFRASATFWNPHFSIENKNSGEPHFSRPATARA